MHILQKLTLSLLALAALSFATTVQADVVVTHHRHHHSLAYGGHNHHHHHHALVVQMQN